MVDLSHIEIHEAEEGSFFVHNNKSGKYVKMGRREVDFLRSLDGQELPEDLQAFTPSVDLPLKKEEMIYLLQKFDDWGFLSPEGAEAASSSLLDKFKMMVQMDMSLIKLFRRNPNAFLERNLRTIRFLLHPVSLVVYAALIAAGVTMLLTHIEVIATLSVSDLTIPNVVGLYAAMFVTTVIHELAHGMVCKYYGGRVKEIGFMLFYLQMAMYCDVSDTYLFKSKKSKVLVSFAGILVQWVLLNVAFLAYFLLQSTGVDAKVLLYYGLLNIGMTVLNMIPFIKLDGYWMLAHGLGITNLRDKSFQFLVSFLVGAKALRAKYSSYERKCFLAYGIVAAVFTPALWVYVLLKLRSTLNHYFASAGDAVTSILVLFVVFHLGKFIITQIKQAKHLSQGAAS